MIANLTVPTNHILSFKGSSKNTLKQLLALRKKEREKEAFWKLFPAKYSNPKRSLFEIEAL